TRMRFETQQAVVRVLERAVVALALAALLYRALIYPSLPPPPGASYGTGDIIDFALGMLVFLVGGACAAGGVVLSMNVDEKERGAAWRPAVVGMTTFVVYYFVHPYVPAIG
ncbi:MAG: hypothetical protein ACU85V_15655, partial [Gammaproteobacteria bacterium]